MELSRKSQIQFAKETLSIIGDDESIDVTTLNHLRNMSSLLVSWVGSDNGIAVGLNEYVGELSSVKQGTGDAAWKDEFKKSLLTEIDRSSTSHS